MNDKPATSKGTWALMAVLAAAVVAFAFFKARPKQERAASAQCRTRLQAISGVVRAYKGSRQGQFPPDLASLESLLTTPRTQRWMCPSDTESSSYDFSFPQGMDHDKRVQTR